MTQKDRAIEALEQLKTSNNWSEWVSDYHDVIVAALNADAVDVDKLRKVVMNSGRLKQSSFNTVQTTLEIVRDHLARDYNFVRKT